MTDEVDAIAAKEDTCRQPGARVTFRSLGAVAPPPGQGVEAIAETSEGAIELRLETTPEGRLRVKTRDERGTDPATATTTATAAARVACTSNQTNAPDRKWPLAASHSIVVNPNITEGLPANISGSAFFTHIGRTLAVINDGTNDCGLSKRHSLKLVSSFTTKSNSNINGVTNSCASASDRVSIVDFGNLSGSTLGLACTRWNFTPIGADTIYESDIRVDNSARSWTTTITGCRNRFHLGSLLAHEFGHFVGLGHVAENGKDDLIMSPALDTCSAAAASLGRGDLTALGVHY